MPSIYSILATEIYLSYPRRPARKLEGLPDDYYKTGTQESRGQEAQCTLLVSCYYRRYWRHPTPYAFIAAETLEKLYHFKARTQAVLDQTDNLKVIASPGVDGIHLRALRKLMCGTVELLAKVCR